MFTDVAELREFYTGALGRLAQRQIRRQVRELWPDVRSQRIAALGYATPLLRPLVEEAERVLALMPARQGVISWPKEGPNRTALVDETALPLPDASVDRVLLVHAVECASDPDILLDEAWRVLTGNGRLMVIVPNRSGLWAQSDATPFGHGSAFSARQLKTLLKEHLFIPEQETRALFTPPSSASFWLRTAPLWERLGRRWCRALAGVHFVEASKQLYAPSSSRNRARPPLLQTARPVTAGLRVG